jgi:hypothetical protein
MLGGLQGGDHPHAVPAVGARAGPGATALQELLQLQGKASVRSVWRDPRFALQ